MVTPDTIKLQAKKQVERPRKKELSAVNINAETYANMYAHLNLNCLLHR